MIEWYIHPLNEHHAEWMSISTGLPGAKFGITWTEEYPKDSMMFMFVTQTIEDAEDRIRSIEEAGKKI